MAIPFKSGSMMPPDAGMAQPFGMDAPPPNPQVVRSMMTPGESRQYGLSQYPRHDWMDVKHVRKE
jgi:hypothetical protein